jgi:integrase
MKRHKTAYPGVIYREGQRVAGSGTERIFYIRFKKNGKVFEEKVGRQYADDMTSARAARIRAARIEGKAKSRKDLRDEKKAEGEKWTIEALWQKYRDHLSGHSLTVDKNRFDKWIKPQFGNKEPHGILFLDVERLRRTQMQGRAVKTVNNVLELLVRIINFGVERGYCLPLTFKIKKPAPNNEKTETLSAEQLKAFFKALDEDPDQAGADIMRLALFSGMRRGEILKLEWRDIDFDRGFISLREPKGGKDQHIPLNASSRAVLERQERSESPLVFPGRGGKQRKDIKRLKQRIKKAAGLPEDFRPLHGLRHAFASALASSGKVDLYTLQRLLTHKSPVMTQRYAHLADEALKRAADVAADIYKIAGGKK